MNKKSMGIVLMGLFVTGLAFAGEMPAGFTPPKPSAELEKIKALEGKWVGTGTEGGKDERTVNSEYHVTSGGSAVEEKLFAGTSHEMVSMYHDVNGKLSMTHYCMLGNQPELELKSTADGKLVLRESDLSKTRLSGQMRMGEVTIEQPDKDTLVQTWTGQEADGKSTSPTVIKLKRSA